ncbi:hypothetical protein I553_4415 [Mycobacterium xenopi 4042]|uniref:Uncharacterized protein n=1 Tax=Mycobacterium xenopi 4042 TaxID=1299334 RepID=X8AF52_MYCXE|nr:hypothetical protein I553_4415 [Mycobacterium xenopi 4042]EUA50852.1 hypothetical protein I552_1792 [Mycobacterium xenopi 3993]
MPIAVACGHLWCSPRKAFLCKALTTTAPHQLIVAASAGAVL